jgi:hypothetical protein
MFGKSIDEQNAIRDARAKKWEKKMEPDDEQVFYEDSIKTLVKRLRPLNGWTSQWNNTTTQSPQSSNTKPSPPEPTVGDLLRELDEIKERLFIITRDIDLEQKYPDLKEAYDRYAEMKRYAEIAEKLASTGKE